MPHHIPNTEQVVEQDFLTYMAGKPGFLILRPRANKEIEKLRRIWLWSIGK